MIIVSRAKFTCAFLIAMLLLFAAPGYASGDPAIEADLNAGVITPDEATIYRAIAVVRPDAVPAKYLTVATAPEKCATELVRDAMIIIEAAPESYRLFKDIMSRPQAQTVYQSPLGYFRMHYDTSGMHAVSLIDDNINGVPDYIERAADYADSVWRYEVLNVGHLPPPSDGTLGGGVDQYDIYFQRLGAYGYTQAESPGPNPWNDVSSHIVVHSSFAGFPPNDDPEGDIVGALKVTIAHEFYHAVQFAYDIGAEIYFMEQSSTWMEEMAFPEVNDNYNYLPYFYDVPQEGLQSTGSHEYGAFVWPKFLQERFGVGVMPAIWNVCRYYSAIVAWSQVLDSAGSSLRDELTRFQLWNYHTGDRAIPGTFASGTDYPQVHVMRYTETIPDSNKSSTELPEPLASNYIVVNNFAGQRGILTIDFTGMITAEWGLAYITDFGSSSYADSTYTTFQGTTAKISIPHFEDVLRVVFIPVVTSSYGTAFNYSYHLYWRIPGDFDGSNSIDISDAVAGISYIFNNGPAPQPLEAMDADCDGANDISDVTYLVLYIFGGGPSPCVQ